MLVEVPISTFQEYLLVVSNVAILPSVIVAFTAGFYAESLLLFMSMISSSFYHFCDGDKIQFCILKYRTLQFVDFYCALYAIWCIAIILAAVPLKWRSVYHISGSVVLAGLLTNFSTGVTVFVVPLTAVMCLIAAHWIYFYRQFRCLPIKVWTTRTISAIFLTIFGIGCFAVQENKHLLKYYGFIHSSWHVFMALALLCLLPSSSSQISLYSRRKPTKTGDSTDSGRSSDEAIIANTKHGVQCPSLAEYNNNSTERSLNYMPEKSVMPDDVYDTKQNHTMKSVNEEYGHDTLFTKTIFDNISCETNHGNNGTHSYHDGKSGWCKTILAKLSRLNANDSSKHQHMNLNV